MKREDLKNKPHVEPQPQQLQEILIAPRFEWGSMAIDGTTFHGLTLHHPRLGAINCLLPRSVTLLMANGLAELCGATVAIGTKHDPASSPFVPGTLMPEPPGVTPAMLDAGLGKLRDAVQALYSPAAAVEIAAPITPNETEALLVPLFRAMWKAMVDPDHREVTQSAPDHPSVKP